MMRVFEAPDKTADAILRMYGEQFILNNNEYDDQWLEQIKDPKTVKAAISELDYWMQEDFALLQKLLKDIRSGKIPEKPAQWLCYQVLPLVPFGTYECTQNNPDQLLIYPEDLPRALRTFDWWDENRKDSGVQTKIRSMYPAVNAGDRKIKNPLDWSIWDMENVQAAMTPEAEAQASNEKWMPDTLGLSPRQAEVAMQEDDVMVVRITEKNAASRYASGTQWCTSSTSVAQNYLNTGDLFVVVRNGNRIGQIHTERNQIMNLQDRPMTDLPPSVARFMLREDIESLKKLVNEWPTDEELTVKWMDDNRMQRVDALESTKMQYDKAMAIYEGNEIDEDSYSRFFMRRVFGTVDTSEIKQTMELRQNELDSWDANPLKPDVHQLNLMRGNNIRAITNYMRGISNMSSRVPVQMRTGANSSILDEATLERLLEISNTSQIDLDLWQLSDMVNDPPDTLRAKMLEALRAARPLNNYTRRSQEALNNFMKTAIRVGGYDLDDFFPGSTDAVIEMMAAIRENGGQDGDAWPFLESLGDVMTEINRKNAPPVNVVWFLKQDRGFQDRFLPRIDDVNSTRWTVTFYATSDSSDPASAPDGFNQLAKLPDDTYTLVKTRLVAGFPKATAENLSQRYGVQTGMTNQNLYKEALVELVRRKEGEQQATATGKLLTAGAVDRSLNARMARHVRNSLATSWQQGVVHRNGPWWVTARDWFVDTERARKLAAKIESEGNNNNLQLVPFGVRWYGDPGFDIRNLTGVGLDAEGEMISFPVTDLREGGDDFGDLRKEVLDEIAKGADTNITPRQDKTGYLSAFVEPILDPATERMLKQINSKGRARPPATLGFVCMLCRYPIELDPADGQWKHPQNDPEEILAFAERWGWQTEFWPYGKGTDDVCQWEGHEGKAYGKRVGSTVKGMPYITKYSDSNPVGVIPMRADKPHLPFLNKGAAILWCRLCTGIRPVPPVVSGSYQIDTSAWENVRSKRPCKCGYTERSLNLYAEDEPTEAEITEEITGALGSGGPTGLNQTAYEAEYTQISGDDMDSFLTDLGFIELPRRPRTERIYDHVYGRGPNGDLVIRVYTSIIDGGGSAAARNVGADSIKVVPLYLDATHGDIPLGKQKRVHRVTGWRDNLRSRISTAQASAPGPVMDSNGKPMRLRRNKASGDLFWGSIDYPNNKETRPYHGG